MKEAGYSHNVTDRKTFVILWLLCILGSWSIFPYLYYLEIIPPSASIFKLFISGAVQAAVVFGVICWLSYKILPKTDLNPFHPKQSPRQLAFAAVISGVVLGLTIFIFDRFIIQTSQLSEARSPPLWAGALASIYGAVNEEVLMRLFLFTAIYFTMNRMLSKRLYALWSANILVALLFGVGHLPILFKVVTSSAVDIFRVLFLNGIGGLMFGWLYWSRGLWTAIAAHFVTDIMIHVLLR